MASHLASTFVDLLLLPVFLGQVQVQYRPLLPLVVTLQAVAAKVFSLLYQHLRYRR
jgi:hypothetical protein